MIRVIFLFLILAGLSWLAILAVQKLTGKQALSLTKAGMYAIISSTVAIVLMFGLVILF
jgi:hypothetical protein